MGKRVFSPIMKALYVFLSCSNSRRKIRSLERNWCRVVRFLGGVENCCGGYFRAGRWVVFLMFYTDISVVGRVLLLGRSVTHSWVFCTFFRVVMLGC